MVKEGYKKTEIGIIPEDWEVKQFKDVGTFFKGQGISMKEVVPSGLPCIMYGDIYVKFDTHFSQADFRITAKTASKSVEALKNDLFFTASGETAEEIGKCVSYQGEENIYIGGDILAVRPNNDYNSLFLAFVQNSKPLIKQKMIYAQGHTIVHINIENIKKLLFYCPSLPEQQFIAEALSDIDELIYSLEKLIDKKKAIKQGAMQELLTGKKRLEGFTGEWSKKRIEDICNVRGGKRLPHGKALSKISTKHPYIRVADMYMGGVNTNEILYVPEDVFDSIKNYTISSEDLFISVAGTLGLIGCIPKKLDGANLTENADKLCDIKCNRTFLMFIMMSTSFQASVQDSSTIGAQPKLALTRIQKFEILLPPTIKEQTAIATILSDMDSEIDALAQKLSKCRTIKQGMMQELLTGRIRLV